MECDTPQDQVCKKNIFLTRKLSLEANKLTSGLTVITFWQIIWLTDRILAAWEHAAIFTRALNAISNLCCSEKLQGQSYEKRLNESKRISINYTAWSSDTRSNFSRNATHRHYIFSLQQRFEIALRARAEIAACTHSFKTLFFFFFH